MNGTSEFFRQDQERFSRLNAANDLADSQFAATDLDEKKWFRYSKCTNGSRTH